LIISLIADLKLIKFNKSIMPEIFRPWQSLTVCILYTQGDTSEQTHWSVLKMASQCSLVVEVFWWKA